MTTSLSQSAFWLCRPVINFVALPNPNIIDFLTGGLYAMNGNLQKLGGGIFLCAPNNVNIEGKITDDTVKSVKGKSKEENEEEFSW